MFCFTSSIVWSETVKPTNLVYRNGIYYKKFTYKPYSGSVRGTDELGYLLKGAYKDGKEEGVWEFYYDNGQIYSLPGYNVDVVDTTGEGDIFAAGVLFGLSKNMSIQESAQIGLFASAKIVTQRGPRLKEALTISTESILKGAHPSDT